jgi:molybdate transport system ATP-binding protein
MLNVRLQQAGPIPLNVVLACAKGELLALVGPSGSGKTSVLRAIAGLMPVASGRVSLDDALWFDGASGVSVATEARPIGMVFQYYALFPHLSALANVMLAVAGSHPREVAQLTGLAQRLPSELSGGQRQRVALARALARKPKVLLLDEPFSAVDQPTRHALYDELIKLRERSHLPIVMVTHDMREARLLADRLCIIDHGETLQEGPPAQVLSRPRNARVAAMIGIRDIHVGRFFSAIDAGGLGRLRWHDAADSSIAGAAELHTVDKGRIDNGALVRWVISGEHVQIHAIAPALPNTLRFDVLRLRQLGEITTLKCRLDAAPYAHLHLDVTTAQCTQMRLAVGAPVFLTFDAAAIHIMPLRT